MTRPVPRVARWVWVAAGICLAGLPRHVTAGDGSLDIEVEAVSSYLFRGQLLNPDPALQPSLSWSDGGFTAELWASVNLTDEFGNAGGVGEVDLTASWSGETAVVRYEAGLSHYRYDTPEVGNTTELFVDLALPWTVEPRLGVAYDVVAADGLYARLGLGVPIDLGHRVSADLEVATGWATAGFNRYSYDVDRDTFNDASVTGTLELETAALGLWVTITRSWLLESDVEAMAVEYYGDADVLVAGVGLAVSF